MSHEAFVRDSERLQDEYTLRRVEHRERMRERARMRAEAANALPSIDLAPTQPSALSDAPSPTREEPDAEA